MNKRIISACLGLLALACMPALAQVNQVPGFGNRDSSGAFFANQEGQKATYSAAITGLVAASSATDIVYITGSATKTIRITRINIGGRATSAASADVQIIRRSTANSGGTCAAMTLVQHDMNTAAPTATVSSCTANPTLGSTTNGGTLRDKQLFLGNLSTSAPGADAQFLFADRASSTIVLRGAAQTIGINLNGVTYSGNLMDVDIEWTEE